MTFGNMHTVTASFESSDSVDKICSFYKSRLPNAIGVIFRSKSLHYRFQRSEGNMVTINVQANGDTSKFRSPREQKSRPTKNKPIGSRTHGKNER